ncbi:ABC transporter ATP-binding protein [Micromonospora echinofusca]|nr:ABC transporter ATP-binding protein [Micromonospora echinofusca]
MSDGVQMTTSTPASSASEMALIARGIRYEVAGRTLLAGADLTVASGQSVAITGPSGSGKTSLVLCLAGLLPVAQGSIHISATKLTGLRAGDRAALRLSRIGVVYQFGELLPELAPVENVALPALLAGVKTAEAYERAGKLLADLGVAELAEAQTATLSGGERQRVAVARALVTRPAVVLADEPTGALDETATDLVADLLYALPRKYGYALVVVTHNPQVAARADSTVVLQGGALVPATVAA